MLSSLLFNVYSKKIFKQALSDSIEGISVNEGILNNFLFADDTGIMMENNNDGLYLMLLDIDQTHLLTLGCSCVVKA